MFTDITLAVAQADTMNGTGWGDEWVAVVAVAFTLGGIALVVWQLVKVLQTKVANAASVDFQNTARQLAADSVASQTSTASELAELRLLVAGMNQRLASIETMMKDVG